MAGLVLFYRPFLKLIIYIYFFLGLTELFKTSRDYDVLKFAWKGWRDASGAKMGHKYAEFVDLSNEALRISG